MLFTDHLENSMKRALILYGSLATLSCASTSPQKVDTSRSPEVAGEEVDYSAGDVTLKGYLAYDKNQVGQRPGILVVHEWWGHNEYTRRRARELAELGYTALAVDMYGDGKQADHPDDAKKFMMEVMEDMQGAVDRFEAARLLLGAHPTTDPEKTAAIGYCFGGAVVLHMARAGADLDAVVAFHAGALETGNDAANIKGRVLVAHGGADPFVEPEAIESFKKAMDAAGARYEFVVYPGAVHAFTNPGATEKGTEFDLPLAYDSSADADSWERMKKLFAGVFPE